MVNFISTLGTMIVTVEENNLGEKTPLSEITNIETPTVPLSLPKRNGKFSAETDKLKKGKGRNGHFTFKENKTKR